MIVEKLVSALTAVEWANVEFYDDGTPRHCCPSCGQEREDGHSEDCLVGTAIAASRVDQTPVSFDLETALDGVKEFMDGEFFRIVGVVDAKEARGQRQDEECRPQFDHCFADQDGGGFTGDDFHGDVFFYIGGGKYLKAEY